MRVVRIGLMGFGTVGSGVVHLLKENRELLQKQTGCQFEVTRVLVRDRTKPRAAEMPFARLTTDGVSIATDPAIDLVIEVMGGYEPAYSLIKAALQHGKQVITANKELIAKAGHELLPLALKHRCDLRYEASVAGSLPVLNCLQTALAGNQIQSIMGIVNSTTNYILKRMEESLEKESAGASDVYQNALREAQAAGYAEADPTADVEGFDAQYKTAILARLAFQAHVPVEQVYREGITQISGDDITAAKKLGGKIKLLGIAQREPTGAVSARVHPVFLEPNHPLTGSAGSNGAVIARGNAFKQMMFLGFGAGSLPTASAVMGDLVEVARNMQTNSTGRMPFLCGESIPVIPIEQTENAYFLRFPYHLRLPLEALETSEPLTYHNELTSLMITRPLREATFLEKLQETGIANEVRWIRALPRSMWND